MKTRFSSRGAVLLPFVLGFFAFSFLFGMSVDAALLLHARHKLFNGAENALLAAANLYDTGAYPREALTSTIRDAYCLRNFLDPAATSLDFNQIDCGHNILILHTEKSIRLLFLRNHVPLRCTLAAALPEPADDIRGLVPLAILVTDPTNPFVLGQEYVIKEDGGEGVSGNYGALALFGTGADNFLDHLKYGYPNPIAIGDVVQKTEPGNMAGPIAEGIAHRLQEGKDIVMVIVTNQFPNGRGPIDVKGFAAFRVRQVGAGGELTGEYVEQKVSAGSNPQAPDYGLHSKSRLIFY